VSNKGGTKVGRDLVRHQSRDFISVLSLRHIWPIGLSTAQHRSWRDMRVLEHENEEQFLKLFESFRAYAEPEEVVDYHLVFKCDGVQMGKPTFSPSD
jgi:hypothetical protein